MFLQALQFNFDNWKVQFMEIYRVEKVIQFNFFFFKSINQIDLINSWQFWNSIIWIAFVIYKYLLSINQIAKLESIIQIVCNSNTETLSTVHICSLSLSPCVFAIISMLFAGCYPNQGILKGEVSLYYWPPVWLVWNQLYDDGQFWFLLAKQTNPNQSNRRSMVQWYFSL